MYKNGTLALCISSLNNRVGSHFHGFTDTEEADGVNASAAFPCRPLELSAAVLNIVINAVDANPANQRAVGNKEVVALMSYHGTTETSNNASIEKGLPLFKTDLELVHDLPPASLIDCSV